MSLVFLFPGQSSRYPEMFAKLLALEPTLRELLDRASEQLHRDLFAHYQPTNKEMFGCNRDIQIGVFLANHMLLTLLEQRGIYATGSLGLSLGEWNHLVHIKALSFEDALHAVEQRGKAYDSGPRGAMASFFPVTYDDLEPHVIATRTKGRLEIVNLNSPRQQVVAGDTDAIDALVQRVEDELFVQGVIIERQVPMHASHFASVGDTFRHTLETLTFHPPQQAYFPNRLAEPLEQPTREQFVQLLSTHVHSPVLWKQSIDWIMKQHPETTFVEVGVKAVLYNLFDRRWHKGVSKFKLDSREELAIHFDQTIEALRPLVTSPNA